MHAQVGRRLFGASKFVVLPPSSVATLGGCDGLAEEVIMRVEEEGVAWRRTPQEAVGE